ncbi:hypothetical protein BC940DRAFT_304202 [Gongronella butleri]|nr:hypothetical protein BC940DRAFT_304202 [Gongronella butleri]
MIKRTTFKRVLRLRAVIIAHVGARALCPSPLGAKRQGTAPSISAMSYRSLFFLRWCHDNIPKGKPPFPICRLSGFPSLLL